MTGRRKLATRSWMLLSFAAVGATALAAERATNIDIDLWPGRSVTTGGTSRVADTVRPARARYKELLRKIEVAKDQATYGDFYDFGYYTGTSYMEHTDLPPGYWVYVAPHWLIYREDLNAPQPPVKAAWGTEQATGAPDTPNAGDIQTAWASTTADGQREWLELTYESPVEAVGVMVYETYNPGAVDAVIAYAGNEQVQVWAGKDPTEPGKPMGVSVMGFSTAVNTNRVRLNIDSPSVSGWNEIDAVGLIDKQGKVHWAVSATASSSFGARPDVPPGPGGPVPLGLPPGESDRNNIR
ncbi:hypothetical protein [Humisphaera borealis]|uniref:Pappalysin-1 SD scarf domain-containing protein n=1 Tax=Humisphaera borealis TaxID=2807512 RepID=A0A7M2WX10_9BACT|nr:hypothetical protein [Humisphaera borealis]QOV89933.1 hypothetical protein IPV69_00745 [Humisphaera borealis]